MTPVVTPTWLAQRSTLIDLTSSATRHVLWYRLATPEGVKLQRFDTLSGQRDQVFTTHAASRTPGHFLASDHDLLWLHPGQQQIIRHHISTGVEFSEGLAEPHYRFVGIFKTPSPDLFLLVDRHTSGKERLLKLQLSAPGKSAQMAVIDDSFPRYRWPSLGQDLQTLSFLTWEHTSVPWENSQIIVAPFDLTKPGDRLKDSTPLIRAQGFGLLQPYLCPASQNLFYIDNQSGYFQLYRRSLATNSSIALTTESFDLVDMNYESMLWDYAPALDGRSLALVRNHQGRQIPMVLDLITGKIQGLQSPLTDIAQIIPLPLSTSPKFAVLGSSWDNPGSIDIQDISGHQQSVVRLPSPPGNFMAPEFLSWSSADSSMVSGLFYDIPGAASNPPTAPLIVMIHSGPLKQVKATWPVKAHYFNQRGYRVFYINFRGSTGHGRDHLHALQGLWGSADADDVLSGIQYLQRTKGIESSPVLLWAGDTGVITLMSVLRKAPQAIAAAIAVYGVLDVDSWEHRNAHLSPMKKWLIGKETKLGSFPQVIDVASTTPCPLALFIGTQDEVVGVADYRRVKAARESAHRPTFWHEFPDEGHQWKSRATLATYYQKVEDFMTRYIPSKV